MHIRAERISLQLKNPFKLSYGASTVRENVLVHISDGLRAGIGEAAVVPYYGETPERVLEFLNSLALKQAIGNNPLRLEDTLDNLPPAPSATATAAVDMALHDLWAKTLGHPLYRLWGLNPARCPASSFTVAMTEDEPTYRKHLRDAAEYSIVKLKLGSGNIETDLRFVQIARDELRSKLCVDANGGWSAEEALAIIPYLAEMGTVFIEQPVAKDDFDGWRVLRETLPDNSPPLIADESVQGLESVVQLAGLVDGVNVKLAKCGGLQTARQMITLARTFGMQVMIGCMIESSVAVTAAAHLAPLADYADLDANLLITNDPYRGVTMTIDGQLTLPDTPGLGLSQPT